MQREMVGLVCVSVCFGMCLSWREGGCIVSLERCLYLYLGEEGVDVCRSLLGWSSFRMGKERRAPSLH